jgi:hypothetical protein
MEHTVHEIHNSQFPKILKLPTIRHSTPYKTV